MDLTTHLEIRRIREEHTAILARAAQLEQRILALEAAKAESPLPAASQLVPGPAAALAPPQPPPLPVLPALPLPPRPLAAAPPPLPTAARKAAAGDSLEMRIGSVWLVRAGVLMLLTFVIFLGAYLYQNIIPHLGPAGKVGLLYLLAGTLTGLGAWLERRHRHAGEGDGLLNYARYILAGGLAAVYYVTYAAHFYPGLQVIQSPLAGGALLLGWTAFMAWLADRRDSQLLATFSLLLAFYASATNEVSGFTLYANLILTAAAVFLLSRRRWTAFSFTALAATFGSYAYWRYGGWLFAGSGAAAVVPAHGGPWLETAFLTCYWLVFTAAAFLDPRGALDVPANKATFVTLNNGALFALGSWLLYPSYADVFWRWPMGFGVVLLGLGDLGRRAPRPLDKATIGAYGLAGIGLVTVGLMMYFVGWRLSLVLAVESAVVLAAASQRNSRPLLWAAGIAAGLSFFNALSELTGSLATTGRADGKLSDDSSGYQAWLTGLGGGAIMLFNSWQSQLWRKRTAALPSDWAAPDYFALLGLALWLVLLEEKLAGGGQLAVVLSLAALGVAALGAVSRLSALTRAAQWYLLAAYWHWVSDYGALPAWWKTLILVGSTVALEHWHSLRRRRAAALPGQAAGLPPWPQLALMIVAVLCAWTWISDRLGRHGEGTFTLAAGWSVYAAAVFALGLALRERVYRWAGLAILGCTLGRIALHDIWQLNMLGRSISAFMLGAVLLAIGFLYNRFQEKLRAWF